MNKSKWRKARALSDKVFLLGMKSSDPRVSKFKMYSFLIKLSFKFLHQCQ